VIPADGAVVYNDICNMEQMSHSEIKGFQPIYPKPRVTQHSTAMRASVVSNEMVGWI